MAHRKPLGTTFTSTFDWQGDDPYLRDYLVSQADTWYRVVGLAETKSLVEALRLPVAERRFKVKLTLERIARPEDVLVLGGGRGPTVVQDEDGSFHWVHPFEWYPREKRRVERAHALR